MSDLLALKDLLGGASDLANVILLYVMWRFDRRLLFIETTIQAGKGDV